MASLNSPKDHPGSLQEALWPAIFLRVIRKNGFHAVWADSMRKLGSCVVPQVSLQLIPGAAIVADHFAMTANGQGAVEAFYLCELVF